MSGINGDRVSRTISQLREARMETLSSGADEPYWWDIDDTIVSTLNDAIERKELEGACDRSGHSGGQYCTKCGKRLGAHTSGMW